MATAQSLITDALTLFNVVEIGGTPSTAQLNDGLTRLQGMIDAWQADGLQIFCIQTVSWTSTGANPYTFGPSGTASTTRFERIVGCRMRISGVDYPIEIWSQQQYAAAVLKTLTLTFPIGAYYDQGYTSTAPTGQASLYFYPICGSGSTLYVDGWQPLLSLSALSDTIYLPPAYQEALTYNLALRLGPAYGQPVTADILRIAQESEARLRARNLRPPFLTSDIMFPTDAVEINWRTGAPWGSPYA